MMKMQTFYACKQVKAATTTKMFGDTPLTFFDMSNIPIFLGPLNVGDEKCIF